MSKKLRNAWLLGLIDGVVIGALSCALITAYEGYRNTGILEEVLDRTLLTETFHIVERAELFRILVAAFLLTVAVFALSSYFAHKHLLGRVRSTVRLWAYIGFMGVAALSVITITATEIDFFLRGGQYGESNVNDHLLPLSKLMVVALVVVLSMNYLYGVALSTSVRLYSAFKQSAPSEHSTTIG
jgi:hypothetical protein